ncbi:Peptidase M14 carboxypeptidase A [Trinorchestia longiramus]|nr:Peptidase M14 carboxypeptidase A [Trinorchestia longiramus]
MLRLFVTLHAGAQEITEEDWERDADDSDLTQIRMIVIQPWARSVGRNLPHTLTLHLFSRVYGEVHSKKCASHLLFRLNRKISTVHPDPSLEAKTNDDNDGYACHRIRPLFKSEKSWDDQLMQQLRDAASPLKSRSSASDNIHGTMPGNGKKNSRKKSKEDVKVADVSSDSERNNSKSSCLKNFANIVSAHLNASLTQSSEASSSVLKAVTEISSVEQKKSNKGSSVLGSGLFNVVQEACAKYNVKWPVECQVVSPAVHHILDWPLYPEPFYRATGSELRPQPVGDETGRLVYLYNPTSAVNYFSRSCVGGNKHVSDEVRSPLSSEDDNTLQFESRFESGNLAKVVQVSECYYELHIRSDLYTARHTQWYYFAISNTRKKMTYRFSIVNMMKCDSLYNHGLRPLLYSEKEAQVHGVGWRRCATNIVYFRNQDRYDAGCLDSDDDGDEENASYTLTFNLTFPHDHDTVYLAHCYPYTFSLLQQHLLSIQNDPLKASICRQRVMCRSLAGNPVYLLTITSNHPEDEGKKKRAIVLTARVHPGETPASWIMKGALDFLTSDNPRAVDLRRQFVFKIVPMINPDGVIVGNHRCSLAARDLNRQYKMVVKEMFPAVWNIKAMVRKLMDDHGVVMYCDFHAHSRKHNTFLYGCENRKNHENHLREQIFPLLLHYNAGDKFSFRGCKFRIHRSKEGTARIVVWMMGVLHSYTLEASFGGATHGTRAQTHFTLLDFTTLGRQFCETLHTYFDPLPVKEKLRHKLWARLVKKGSNADEPTAVDLSDSNSSSDDSDKAATSSSAALVRPKKKKGAATGTSTSKVNVRKRIGHKGSSSAVEKLGRQAKADKMCLSPSHYDDSTSINSLTRHLSSSSTDVPKTYVYDPNTLTLVRRSLNRHSTGSLDLVDQSPSGATKHFLAHDSNSGELVSDATAGKVRSSSLRVKKSKTARKSRPSSSRNRQKSDGSPKFEEAAGTPRVRSPTVINAPPSSGDSPLASSSEFPTSIRIQSPNFSRRTVVTPSLIQPANLPHSPEGIGAVGCSEYRRASQTKTYMERMSEMNARLAVSDQEVTSLMTSYGIVVIDDVIRNSDVIQNSDVIDDVIQNSDVIDDVIQNSDVIDDAIRKSDVIDDVIRNSDVIDDVIQNSDVIDDVIQDSDVIDDVIQNSDVIDDVIRSSDVIDDVIRNSDGIDDVIRNSDVIDDVIQNSDVIDDVIQNSDVIDDVIQNSDVIDDDIQNSDVIDDVIQNSDVIDDVIQNSDVIDDVIQNSDVIDDAIQNSDVIDDAIRNSDVIDDAIRNYDVIRKWDVIDDVILDVTPNNENVRFWDADSRHSSPHHQEILKKCTPSHRPVSIRTGGDRESIGPIVGKNLFNDPRKVQSNTARRTLTSTTKSPRCMFHRSLTNLCPPNTACVGVSPRSVPPYFSGQQRANANERPPAHKNRLCLSGVEESYSPVNREEVSLNSNYKHTGSWLPSVLLEKGESEKLPLFVNTQLAKKGDVPIYHSTGNLLNLDYVDPHPVIHQRVNKIIEASTYVSSQGNESSSSDSGYRSKQCDQYETRKTGKSADPAWEEDDSRLCADIETCDTLFLDIGGTKEPPELKVARNSKERVKKKKSSKEKLFEESNEDQSTTSVTKSNSSPNKLQPVNDVSVLVEKSSEAEEPTVKIKKKIKIVIGRKPKAKLLRKKSLTDQTT